MPPALEIGRDANDPADMIAAGADPGPDRSRSDVVVFPKSPVDVARVVRWAARHAAGVIPTGTGARLSGGSNAEHGGVFLSFSRMHHVLEMDPTGRSAVVEPGVSGQWFGELVQGKGLSFPPSSSNGRTVTIGGNVGENAAGPHGFKYGAMTDYVTGLEIVTANGQIKLLGGRALDYPEYDLCGVISGSRGTLAIVTKVFLRLVRKPPAGKTLAAAFETIERASAAVASILALGIEPSTIEIMAKQASGLAEDCAPGGQHPKGETVLIVDAEGYQSGLDPQFDAITRVLEEHGGRHLRTTNKASETGRLWQAGQSLASTISRLVPAYIILDCWVPRASLEPIFAALNKMVEEYGLNIIYVMNSRAGDFRPLIPIGDPADKSLIDRVQEVEPKIAAVCAKFQAGNAANSDNAAEGPAIILSKGLPAAERDLKEVFDPRGWLKSERAQNGTVERALSEPPPGSALLLNRILEPTTIDDAVAVIQSLNREGAGIRIRGGGTKSSSPPDLQAMLSTKELRGIKAYSAEGCSICVGAGSTLGEVQAFLAGEGRQIPLATPWPGSTLGGIVATNTNAPLRLRYGAVRDLLLGLTVVVGDGRILRAGVQSGGKPTGYDLPKLFAGSYGTLGLIAETTFRVSPLPPLRRTLLVPITTLAEGLGLAGGMLGAALVASAIVLGKGLDVPGLPASPYLLTYTAEGWPDEVVSELKEVRGLLNDQLSGLVVEVEAPSGTDLWCQFLENSAGDTTVRVGVAPKDLAAYLTQQSALFGRASFLADFAGGLVFARAGSDSVKNIENWVEELRRPALSVSGYAIVTSSPATGELDHWGYQPAALDLMREIKLRWDPRGILNRSVFVVD